MFPAFSGQESFNVPLAKLLRAGLRCCRLPRGALRLENACLAPLTACDLSAQRGAHTIFCRGPQGLGIMREELDLNMENNEKWKDLPYFLKRWGKCRKQVVQFEGNPGKPDLNDASHKSRWRNYRGSLHLHGDETHTPEWRKKNKREKLRQVFYSWASVILKYVCPFVNFNCESTRISWRRAMIYLRPKAMVS